jgi:hypothetical protein
MNRILSIYIVLKCKAPKLGITNEAFVSMVALTFAPAGWREIVRGYAAGATISQTAACTVNQYSPHSDDTRQCCAGL